MDGSIFDGDVSLRDAIAAAAPGETIDFAPALTNSGPATLFLALGELSVSKNLTIQGPGANLLSIDASNLDSTPGVKDGNGVRVLRIDDGDAENTLDVAISGLTLTGGDVGNGDGGIGGAIYSIENLTVTASKITGNHAKGNGIGFGGGIYSRYASLSLINTEVSNNEAYLRGGGIFSEYGTTSLLNCIVTANKTNANYGDGGGGMWLTGDSTIESATISGNSCGEDGGGLRHSNGMLTITSSTFNENSAARHGGGLSVVGSDANLEDCTIAGNTANEFGGGIHVSDDADFIIADSLVSGNEAGDGGGLYCEYANLTAIESRFVDNVAFSDGGGLYISTRPEYDQMAVLTACQVEFNESYDDAGGIANFGNLTITGCTIRGNETSESGGGVFHVSGNLRIEQSTVVDNFAGEDGGGVSGLTDLTLNDAVTIASSTISGNTAGERGGGVSNRYGLTKIQYSTITNNTAPIGSGGGVATYGYTDYTRTEVRSTIIAGNHGDDVAYVNGTANSFQSNGFNLIGVGNAVGEFTEAGDQTSILDPMLAPLADNGGATASHALLFGCPALDAGDPTLVPGTNDVPSNDQRGALFDRVSGPAIDVGSFESQAPPLLGDYNFDAIVDAADYTVWRNYVGQQVGLWGRGDGNGDGEVNSQDYTTWKNAYGNSLPLGSGGLASGSSQSVQHAPEGRDEVNSAAVMPNSFNSPYARANAPVVQDRPLSTARSQAYQASDGALVDWLASRGRLRNYHESSPPLRDSNLEDAIIDAAFDCFEFDGLRLIISK